MRKSLLVLALALLLAGCSAAPAGETPPAAESLSQEEPVAVARCRVVDGVGTDTLVLAGLDGGAGDVYTLGTAELAVEGELTDGAVVEVRFDGAVMESYPAQFSGVTGVQVTEQPVDDRCGLYLQVLEDLWEVDPGLNTDLEELGVDFSGLTDLTESEKSALAWVFGNAHGLMPITGTLEELWQAGCLTPMTEPAEGQEGRVSLYRWEDGCLFVLTGSAEDGFDAEKWTSGIGAYMFVDCTVRQNADGTWSYTIGAEAIS